MRDEEILAMAIFKLRETANRLVRLSRRLASPRERERLEVTARALVTQAESLEEQSQVGFGRDAAPATEEPDDEDRGKDADDGAQPSEPVAP
jgi:hypothetical protein